MDSDWINLLYAEKIDRMWYFYLGESFIIDRRGYKWPQRKPMSFAKLREVSRALMVGHYYKNKMPWQNTYEIDQKGFDSSWTSFTDCFKKAHRLRIRCYCNDSHFPLPKDSAALYEFEHGHHPALMEDCPK